MAAISLEVHGIVQGVGFRYMTKILADQIGVTGKVLNKNDGSGRVDRVILKSIPENSYTRFSVVYM